MARFNQTLPEWQSAGTKPSTSLITGGWKANDHPPAPTFNWIHNTTYAALKELQETAANLSDVATLQTNIDKKVSTVDTANWQKYKIVSDTGAIISYTGINLLDTTDGKKYDGYASGATNQPAGESNSGYFRRSNFSSYIEVYFSPYPKNAVYRNVYNFANKVWVGWERLAFASEVTALTTVVNSKVNTADTTNWQKYALTQDSGQALQLSSPNLDTVFSAGFYYCITPTNAPGTGNGYLHVQIGRPDNANNEGYFYQEYTEYSSGNKSIRQKKQSSAVWADWVTLASVKDVESSTAQATAHTNAKNNPHAVTKTQVGLSNVDNTSDVNKPVSTAQASAIAATKTALQTNIDKKVNTADTANWQKDKIWNDDGLLMQKNGYDLLNTTDITSVNIYVTSPVNAPENANGSGYFKRNVRSGGYSEVFFSPFTKNVVYRNTYNAVTAEWLGWEQLANQSIVTELQTTVDAKANTSDLANYQKGLITSQDGTVKFSQTDKDASLLSNLVALGKGLHTFYCVDGVKDNPAINRAIRGICNLTGTTSDSAYGWVIAYDTQGNEFKNYINGQSGWLGWKSSYIPLWSGTANGAGATKYTLTKSISEFDTLRITYRGLPGSNYVEIVKVNSVSRKYTIGKTNLVDNTAASPTIYEFCLDFSSLNSFFIERDISYSVANAKGNTAANEWTIVSIEGAM